MWRIQPTAATITSTNNGSSWDGDGSAPDVYVATICPGSTTTATTASVESYSPTWTSGGCTAKASDILASQWRLQLWDEDVTTDDTITSLLSFQFNEAHLLGGSVSFTASGGMSSLTVQLQKQ